MTAKDVRMVHMSFTNRKWRNFIQDIPSLFWHPRVQALPYSMWLHLIVRWYTQLADFAWGGSRLSMVLEKKFLINLSAWTTVFMSCQFCYFFCPFCGHWNKVSRDFNTRFSGINEENYATALLPLASIRETLDTYLDSNTILIGHALDNDLKTLRILHHKCIDTALLFPHRAGAPYRRALKDL